MAVTPAPFLIFEATFLFEKAINLKFGCMLTIALPSFNMSCNHPEKFVMKFYAVNLKSRVIYLAPGGPPLGGKSKDVGGIEPHICIGRMDDI